MRPVSTRIPKNAKYSKADIIAGTKHELEHTRDRKLARATAIQHLNSHPKYYHVLPAAEEMMSALENKPLVKRKKRRRQRPAGSPLPTFGFNLGF